MWWSKKSNDFRHSAGVWLQLRNKIFQSPYTVHPWMFIYTHRSRQTASLSMLFTLSAICSLILKHFQKMVKLGDTVPNFTAATTHGKIDFHTWIEGSWSILFSHPADYTPVSVKNVWSFINFLIEWNLGMKHGKSGFLWYVFYATHSFKS